jgi:hypothetical protein
MAKFKYYQNIEGDIGFDGSLDLKVKQQGELAVWTDDETGAKIKVEGKNFEVSEENEDYLGGGKIHSVEVIDDDGKTVLTVSDLIIKATKVMATFEESGTQGLLYAISMGDDKVVGSKKGDYLLGGDGDDVMTGGKGADYFDFHAQVMSEAPRAAADVEHDIITDFDWKGDDADSLAIYQDFTVKGIHDGDDTRLKFEDGSTLVLEGVKKAQFENWWDSQQML